MTNEEQESADVIKRLFGLKAVPESSRSVSVLLERSTIWRGDVHVFKILGHQTIKQCYVWSVMEGENTRHVAVLHVPPIDSAHKAVEAYFARKSESKE